MSPDFLWGFTVGFVAIGFAVVCFSEKRNKYVQYVPPTAQVLKKEEWAKIERNIAAEITKAKSTGINIGRQQILDAMSQSINAKKSHIEDRRPYTVFGLVMGQEKKVPSQAAELKAKYENIKDITDDQEITDLCNLRIAAINRAVYKINGFKRSFGDI